ncbi:MAG: M1 family aminopeptidase [Burkholderiales bacterium]|nr:M1 family aminopeptidase [Burkholderiales bacterium]
MRFAALAAGALLAGAAMGAPTAHYDIAVRIDPATRALAAEATLRVPPAAETVTLGARFAVERILLDGQALAASPVERGADRVYVLPPASGARTLALRWHGTLASLDRSLDHRRTLGHAAPVAGTEGTFLPSASAWYPVLRGRDGPLLASYRAALDLPASQRGLVPGRLVEAGEVAGRYRATFEFLRPAEGIDLMAGPYRVQTRTVRGRTGSAVALRTYFHAGIDGLAPAYLDAIEGYLDLYETWIGPYPFTEFSIVSSPTPTGFGMPTLAYLGERVLALPFIRATSLGHEVLHNWWGNGVYPDWASGNWSEGLTTFMADYAYKERESAAAAREMRLAWLRDLAAVPPGADRPLAAFTARTHGTSQIVGYHKAAMLFLMLRDDIGAAAFDAGIRRFWTEHRFRVASWQDLRGAFEAASGRSLAGFFAQWLERPGLPAVRIAHAERRAAGDGHAVRLMLEQDAPAFALRVPLRVRSAAGDETHVLKLHETRQTFEVPAGARPLALALDPDFHVLRRLAEAEAPPILRQAMVAPRAAVAVLGAGAAWRDAAERLAGRMFDAAPRELAPGAAPPSDAALLAIGPHEAIDGWLAAHGLPPRPPALGERSDAQAWAAARVGGAPLAVVAARDPAALETVARLLPHYGRQSFVVFETGRVAERGVWTGRPVAWQLE